MLGSQDSVAVSGAALTAQSINEASVGDRNQPWRKRPGRIVRVPDRMDGQQDVLNCILNVAEVAVPSCRKRPQMQRDPLQEPMISGSVTLLGASHQGVPVGVTDGGLSAVRRNASQQGDAAT